MAEVTDGTGLMDIEHTERNGPEGNVGAVGETSAANAQVPIVSNMANDEQPAAHSENTNLNSEGTVLIVDSYATEGETHPNEEVDIATSPSNAGFHLHVPDIEHLERDDTGEDPNNLITPIHNINAFVSENILHVQQYVMAEAHNASTDKILTGFDNFAKMMQTLIKQRED
jgi:hypothetical protein